MRKALAYMYPYIADKKTWPKPPDVQYHEQWPVRHPALFFGGQALGEPRYIELWKKLDADPTVDEVVRNFPGAAAVALGDSLGCHGRKRMHHRKK